MTVVLSSRRLRHLHWEEFPKRWNRVIDGVKVTINKNLQWTFWGAISLLHNIKPVMNKHRLLSAVLMCLNYLSFGEKAVCFPLSHITAAWEKNNSMKKLSFDECNSFASEQKFVKQKKRHCHLIVDGNVSFILSSNTFSVLKLSLSFVIYWISASYLYLGPF